MRCEMILIIVLLSAPISAELIFFDDFEYDVGRDDTQAVETFQTNGWAYAKTQQDSDRNPGGYLYTVDSIPGYTGDFPGTSSEKALVLESRPSQQEIIGGFLQQTDFYLQYGGESGSIGTIPPDVWFQFWIYNNDYGDQQSIFARSNKWIYPTRVSYPCTGDMCRWLLSIGTSNKETDGSYGADLGNGPDVYITNRPPEAVFAGASEVPTNQDKLGSNLAPDTYIQANTWTLVKIHIDTSGEQGTFEMWLQELGGDMVKTTEWIGGVTDQFTWPIPSDLRDGHKMFRMPTTMNLRLDHGYGGDSWSYMDDFAMATDEADLPTYGPGSNDGCPDTFPDGMLVCEDFEDQDYSDSFSTYSRNQFMTIQDSFANTGNYAVRSEYTPDYGAFRFDLPHNSQEGDEYYLKWYTYYPDTWDWSQLSNTNFKQLYSHSGSQANGNPVFMISKYNTGGCPTGQMRMMGTFQNSNPNVGGQGDCFSDLSLETWHKWEFHVKYSTTDGEVSVTIDDIERLSLDNINSLSHLTIDETAFFQIPTMNGRGTDSAFYVDDIEIWDGLPTGSTTCTPIHIADINPCNQHIEPNEMITYMLSWIQNNGDMQDLLNLINIWKNQ